MSRSDQQPSRLARALWALSGHSADDLVTTGGRARALATTLAIFLSTALAAAGGTVFATTVWGLAIRPALAFGAGWGIAVFILELLFVTTPASSSVGRRIAYAVPRVAVSLVVSYLISGALMSFIYRADIEDRLASTNATTVEGVTEQVMTTSEPALRKAELTAERAALDAALVPLQAAVQQAYASYDAEATGTGGTMIAGCKQLCIELRTTWEQQKAALDAVVTQQAPRRAQIDADIQTADGQIQTLIIQQTPTGPGQAGPEARREALTQLREERPGLNRDYWLLTVALVFIECAAVLSKTMLPQSDHDRRASARSAAAADVAIAELEEDTRTAREAARIRGELERDLLAQDADVERAAARSDAEEHLATRQVRPHVSRTRPAERTSTTSPSAPRRPGRRRRGWSGAIGLVVVAVLVSGAVPGGFLRGDEADSVVAVAAGGTAELGGGLQLTVPAGAVADDEGVTAEVVPASSRPGHLGGSQAVHLSTAGELTGDVSLSWRVPDELRGAAADGMLQLAYQADGSSEWVPHPASYDPASGLMTGSLEHFSTWKFWEWDWASIGAAVSQNVLHVAGVRTGGPDCGQRGPEPEWVSTLIGVEDGDGIVLRSCAGSKDDDVLVIEISNNRPYGQWLDYGGAAIDFGWHETAQNASDVMRNLVGDHSGLPGSPGMYLPPLGKASVGILAPAPGQTVTLKAWPTIGTFFADAWAVVAGDVFDLIGKGATSLLTRNVFTQDLAGSCFSAALGAVDLGWLDPDWATTPSKVVELMGSVAPCVSDALVVQGRSMVARGELTEQRLDDLSGRIAGLGRMGSIDGWIRVAKVYEQLIDFMTDRYLIGVDQQRGFGFTVRATSVVLPDEPTTTEPAPSTPPSTPTTPADEPAAPGTSAPGTSPSTTPPSTAEVPAPSTTQPPASQPPVSEPPVTQAPTAGLAVVVYDHYGPAEGAGIPVCRGNPGRPESMPGGTVSQTFTPTTPLDITTATVQIDPDDRVRVRADVVVGGVTVATAESVAAGDTTFDFGRVPVEAGTPVTLQITFTADSGKIVTVYRAGSGDGGVLTVTNSCSDGAPSLSSTDVGLRATVSGVTR